jgi:perosamine synthetase
MIITDSKKYAEKARYLSTQANDDSMRYIHNEIGFNYRLTNVQAALGVGQLEQLNEFVSKKIYINNFYKDSLKNSENFSILDSPDYANNNHWMTSIVIRKNNLNLNELLDYFTHNKIQVRPMWHLCHLQRPYLDKENFMIEKAIAIQKKIINIPCSTNISDNDLDKVSNVILNL